MKSVRESPKARPSLSGFTATVVPPLIVTFAPLKRREAVPTEPTAAFILPDETPLLSETATRFHANRSGKHEGEPYQKLLTPGTKISRLFLEVAVFSAPGAPRRGKKCL